MKLCVIGCGLRTPLLLHGVVHSGLKFTRIALHDVDSGRADLMEALGRQLARESGIEIEAEPRIEAAIEDSDFAISSIRAGGMEARARDERITLEHGYAGQETTGPGGLAMALRTVPLALEHARLVARLAPRAWLLNFTNPAGLITQAIATYTEARVAGICDTPAELFHRIALALNESPSDVECGYIGLNHLGWVNSVNLLGADVLPLLLQDDAMLRRLYPAALFDPALIRGLGLLPTEYLFFYYSQRAAVANQRRAGATRGEELLRLNQTLLDQLERRVADRDPAGALRTYRAYLNRRNASYLRLEAEAEGAGSVPDYDWDPFEGATGYHRIAVEAMRGLAGAQPLRIVLNVVNRGAIPDLAADDVVEVPCMVDHFGPAPVAAGPLPETVRGLVISVKTAERLAIEAAMTGSRNAAALSLVANPIIGEWAPAQEILSALIRNDSTHLGYLASTAGMQTAVEPLRGMP